MATKVLTHKDFLQIDRDYEKAAKVASLVYVSDANPGIKRIKKGKGFCYIYNDHPLKDKNEIERIRKLGIPPAWTNVWICPLENGHIQATGLDLRKRKQYRYHNLWNTLRHETKFHRMYEFGKALPSLRLQVEKDLARAEPDQQKVLALVISLMERTYIRIGNSGYEKLYGSYGLTTLKDKHVTIEGNQISFCFKGKKGIDHAIKLKNRRLARAVKECREIPGKELFQYFTENGEKRSIDSGMVNNYLKEHMGMECSAKDFRTWAGSLHILWAFKSVGEAISESEKKKKIVEALDIVSRKLGNTRTVCKKYYVHPGLVTLYETNNLDRYVKDLDEIEHPDDVSGLTHAETILMKILKSLHDSEKVKQ
jgi:DNA topoisomerase-1